MSQYMYQVQRKDGTWDGPGHRSRKTRYHGKVWSKRSFLLAHLKIRPLKEGDRIHVMRAEDVDVTDDIDSLYEQNVSVPIVVNGREKTSTKRVLSYEDIVELSDLRPGYGYSMTYRTRRSNSDFHRHGMLSSGEKVEIEKGMIFSVCDTSNA